MVEETGERVKTLDPGVFLCYTFIYPFQKAKSHLSNDPTPPPPPPRPGPYSLQNRSCCLVSILSKIVKPVFIFGIFIRICQNLPVYFLFSLSSKKDFVNSQCLIKVHCPLQSKWELNVF